MRLYLLLPLLVSSLLISSTGEKSVMTYEYTSASTTQYYFGELKIEPDWYYFNVDEPITIHYTNEGFDSVYIIRRRLEKLKNGEWVVVRPPRRWGRQPPSPGNSRPRRLPEIGSRETITYSFPAESLPDWGFEQRGTYRYMLHLTSRPNEPDYAVLYREFAIR